MLKTIDSLYKDGQIMLNTVINIPDESKVNVSFWENSIEDFYLNSSECSLDKIWSNEEDDVYEQLLKN